MEAREFGAQENGDADGDVESTLMECAMDALEEIFFVFTPEGDLLEWNQRIREVTGYTGEQIEKMHPTDFVPNSEKELIRRQIQKVLEEGQTRFESFFQTKKGREIPYEFTGSLLQQNGTPLICGTGRDISERKKAQKEKKASEKRYRRLFEDAQEGITISTPEGEIKEANPAAADIMGYSREELKALDAAEVFFDPDERKQAIEELEEKGALEQKELRLRRKDGTGVICEISTTIRRGPEGELEAFQNFFRDVTEQKKAEKALKESEEMFRKLAEGALVGIGLIQDGTYEYANPALEEITGYPREELVGKSLESLVAPKDWPKIQARIEKRLEGEELETPVEMRIQAKSGETRLVEVAGNLIDYQGKPTLIGTMQDITERRELQQEVLSVQEEERRRLGQELHDGIASQLTGAGLKLGLLAGKAEGEVAEGIEEVQAIIDDSTSDVRRLSRGLNPAGLPEGDLFSALEGLVGTTESVHLEGADLEGSDGDEAGLPPLGEDAATHLYRIAQEAVNNARKYAGASEIAVRLRKEGDTLSLEVEDNGKGFDPEEVRGEGLGLRSMRHRAELLGAKLRVDSIPGQGTLVHCRLPL